MKLKLGWVLLAITVFLTMFSLLPKNRGGAVIGEQGMLHTEIFAIKGGYGYRIWSQEKLLVQQETIPGIAGNIPFTTPKDAQLVAYLVKRKLTERKNPRVQRTDLEKMAINIPTLDRSTGMGQTQAAFK